MICPSCRAQIEDGVNECGYCGYAFVPRHSRRNSDTSSKVDYDLKEYMQKHLEKNGNGGSFFQDNTALYDTTDDNSPIEDQRHIVAQPPSSALRRPSSAEQNSQPIEVEISTQRQLPRISPQQYTTQEAYVNKDNTKSMSNHKNESGNSKNGKHKPGTDTPRSQQTTGAANSLVVGASDIRSGGRSRGTQQPPQPQAAQPQMQPRPKYSAMSSRELAEQIVNQVMEKPIADAVEPAGVKQPIEYEHQTWPVRKPMSQKPPVHNVQPIPKPAPEYQQPEPYRPYNPEPQPPRDDAPTARQEPDPGPYRAETRPSSPEVEPDYKPYKPITRPVFEQPDTDSRNDSTLAEATGNMRPDSYSATVHSYDEAIKVEKPEVYDTDISDQNDSNDLFGFAMATDSEPYEEEKPEQRLFAEPISSPEVYQSETYFAPESETYSSDSFSSESYAPSGDEDAEDAVPPSFDPEGDKLGFITAGDESSADDLPEDFLNADIHQPESFLKDEYIEPGTPVDIPDPDTFIPDDGTMLPDMDIIDSSIDEELMAEELSRDSAIFNEPGQMTMAEAAAAVVKDDRRLSGGAVYDMDVNSDDAPTRPVSKSFYESQAIKEPRKKKRTIMPVVIVLGILLIAGIGHALNLWISRSYGSLDVMLNTLFGGGADEVTVDEVTRNGNAAHQVTLRSGKSGDFILESVNGSSCKITGGVASLIIYDSVWIPYYPVVGDTPIPVSLDMYIQDSDGNRTDLPSKTYTIDIPMTAVTIEWENAERSTRNETINVVMNVEQGTKVTIDNQDVSRAIKGQKLDYNVPLDPGTNTISIKVQTKYKLPFEEQFEITRVEIDPPSSPAIAPTGSNIVETDESQDGIQINNNAPQPDA